MSRHSASALSYTMKDAADEELRRPFAASTDEGDDDDDDEQSTSSTSSSCYEFENEPHPGYRLIKIRNRTNFFDAKWWWMVDLKRHDDAPRQGATLLVERAIIKYGWDEPFTRRVLTGYKQFLTLKKELGDWETHKLLPCFYVDLLWQVHLGDLNGYLHDTILLCDRVVERSNELTITRRTKRQLERKTLAALKSRFGELFDEPLWLDQVDPTKKSIFGGRHQPYATAHGDGVVYHNKTSSRSIMRSSSRTSLVNKRSNSARSISGKSYSARSNSVRRSGRPQQQQQVTNVEPSEPPQEKKKNHLNRLLFITPKRMGCMGRDGADNNTKNNNNNKRRPQQQSAAAAAATSPSPPPEEEPKVPITASSPPETTVTPDTSPENTPDRRDLTVERLQLLAGSDADSSSVQSEFVEL